MSRSIRISEERWKALRVAAAESGERIQAIADGMLAGVENGSDATTSVRLPKELWHRVRTRALARNESGMSWLTRCAEVALAKVELTRETVEPGSVTEVVVPMRSSVTPRQTKAVGDIQEPDLTRLAGDPGHCPRCGCPRLVHQAGGHGERCERHPACVWATEGV